MPDDHLSLSVAIERLRDELINSQASSKLKPLHFTVEEIELELQLVATDTVEGDVSIGWKVLGANVGADRATEKTHRLKLKLRLAADENGEATRISGPGRAPQAGLGDEGPPPQPENGDG